MTTPYCIVLYVLLAELGSREKRYFLAGKGGKKKEEERKGGKKEREKGEKGREEKKRRERRFNSNSM